MAKTNGSHKPELAGLNCEPTSFAELPANGGRVKPLPILTPRRQFLTQATTAGAVLATGGISTPGLATTDSTKHGVAAFLDKSKTFDSSLKQLARQDYRRSFQTWGGQLSNSPDELFHAIRNGGGEPTYDFLIIGSGYGGSILAARLSAQAHSPDRIAIFERGREWVPGTFPDRFSDLSAQTRETIFGPQRKQLQNPLGLFDVRVNDEIDVMAGSGLGGTSLINASIALRPSPDVFWEPEWPSALRDMAALEPYYELTELTLDMGTIPGTRTRKVQAQQQVAEFLGYRNERTWLSIALNRAMLDAESRNRHGVIQRPCTYCGDCITGCNIGAKGTLTTSYLPLAKRNGVRMFTQTEVRYLEPCAVGWRVHFTHWQDNGRTIDPVHDCVTTANVVLGAGSLGTTELLLRSQQHGLSVSSRLGCKWSTNGDGLGILRKAKTCPNAVGVGAYPIDFAPVGPSVETTTFVNEHGPLLERLLIQEGAIPRAAANFFGLLFGNPDIDNTLAILAVGHDTAEGKIRLVDNRASVFWPGVQDSEHRARLQRTIARFAEAHGANYRVIRAFGDRLSTVHPLGGCSMGDSTESGVVNHLGQVFANCGGHGVEIDHEGQSVYEGLYVADGSIVPRSLGANPYLTICALSERIAFHMPNTPSLAKFLRSWG
ncbi:MAG: GMC family oxidoreductase [Pirellulaceae bacterium]|nr:GMC family oxidoreductase [Pirellulaceae bacterium]